MIAITTSSSINVKAVRRMVSRSNRKLRFLNSCYGMFSKRTGEQPPPQAARQFQLAKPLAGRRIGIDFSQCRGRDLTHSRLAILPRRVRQYSPGRLCRRAETAQRVGALAAHIQIVVLL